MYISIIGTGRVAGHLSRVLEQKGHTIREVYGRHLRDADRLARQLYQAEPQDHLDFSESDAELFIIAVSDSAIEAIAEEVVLPDDAVIVHTSGTVPMDVLEKTATEHIGVFYPLQTFSDGLEVSLDNVPILLDSRTARTTAMLEKVGMSVSKNVVPMSEDDRKQIHLAAVFANNFTNYMLGAAERILAEREIDPRILRPLVEESARKFFKLGADTSQSGPAVRGDHATIHAHTEMLADMPELQYLYKVITQQLLDRYA